MARENMHTQKKVNDSRAEARSTVGAFSHECCDSRGNTILTAQSHSGQIRRFHWLSLALNQKQRCWELQSSCGTFWDFISLSWQGHGVWRCASPYCQSSRQTHRGRTIIQLQGSSYNSYGPVFYFLPPPPLLFWELGMLHVLFNFHSQSLHLTSWPPSCTLP